MGLSQGGIWLGEGVEVSPGAYIAGPAIIGSGSKILPGAYIRGHGASGVIIGRGASVRAEVKNSVIMDRVELCHISYVGDSILGYKSHFGCQAITANLGLFGAELSLLVPGDGGNPGIQYRLGTKKVGVMMGDWSQLGCNSVTDPATFLGRETHIYPLTRLSAGVYGPFAIVKNQPQNSPAVSRSELRPPE